MIEVDGFIVLGTKCATTINVRRIYGTSFSYPMDWWITPLSAIPKLVEAGFMPSIWEECLENVGQGASIRNNKNSILHHHDFDRDEQGKIVSNWREQIDEVRSRHERRSARLRRLLEDSENIVMFLDGSGSHEWILENHNEGCFTPDVYLEIRDALRASFPRPKFDLVISGYAKAPVGRDFYLVDLPTPTEDEPWYSPDSYDRGFSTLPFAPRKPSM